MPPIRPTTPDYGLSELGPLNTGGYNPNAMTERLERLESANQLYLPGGRPRFPLNVMQPYHQQRGRETLARGAAGFVPVAGTAVNWNQMAPWERGLSMGLDAVDLATLGGGRALTTPARWGAKAARNALRYNDPKMISVRAGFPPIQGAPGGIDAFGEWPGWATPRQQYRASQGDPLEYIPSTNYITGQPEAGLSVYQALKFPRGQGSVLRSARDVDVEHAYPPGVHPLSMPGRPRRYFTQEPSTYKVNPLVGQESMLRDRRNQLFEVAGDVIPGARGSDLERLIDPATIGAVTPAPFSKFFREPQRGMGRFGLPTGLGSGTGLPLASGGMASRAYREFQKYGPTGIRYPDDIDRFIGWTDQARLGSSLPWTSSFRTGTQTAPFLEEQYQQRAPRPKSAPRGGPRAPGEGLFNPISPSI